MRQMRYFVAVAEELHFGRAAERVHVAQPALSKQVMQLERELGVRLLDRRSQRGRRVELTGAGKDFLQRARSVLDQAEQAGEEAARAGRGEAGRLTVGFTDMTLYGVVPQVAREFGERYPGVELELRQMCTRTMTEALLGGQLDAGFLHPPVGEAADRDLAVQPIVSEPLIAALPEDHELAELGEIPLSKLSGERFVMVSREEGPELHDKILSACHAAGFVPSVFSQSVPSHTTAIGLVAAGVGVSLVGEGMRNLRRPGVLYRPLTGEVPFMPTAVSYRREDPSPVQREFISLVAEITGNPDRREAGLPDAAVPA